MSNCPQVASIPRYSESVDANSHGHVGGASSIVVSLVFEAWYLLQAGFTIRYQILNVFAHSWPKQNIFSMFLTLYFA